MTPEQIKEIVKITVDELIKRKLLESDTYSGVLAVVSVRLKQYFSGTKDAELRRVLVELSDDPYIDVIYFIYRDGMTMERIAEALDRDVSTIKRNKKRLVNNIFKMLEI